MSEDSNYIDMSGWVLLSFVNQMFIDVNCYILTIHSEFNFLSVILGSKLAKLQRKWGLTRLLKVKGMTVHLKKV